MRKQDGAERSARCRALSVERMNEAVRQVVERRRLMRLNPLGLLASSSWTVTPTRITRDA
jgi:hypothetical protein